MIGRVAWLIKLRWLAVLALAAVSLLVRVLPQVHLPAYAIHAMLAIVALIAFYNLLLYTGIRKVYRLLQIDTAAALNAARRLTHIQIVADLICLTVILDLAGGLINPLCVFMVFHIAIAGIILPRREAFLIALLAGMLLTIMGMVGALWPTWRVPIDSFPLEAVYRPTTSLSERWFFTFSVSFALSCTFFLIAYFTSGISRQLHLALANLEDANATLHRQSEVKSRFLRIIAHQLRSPLAAIISLAHAYLGSAEQQTLPEGLRNLLVRIERRCQAMMGLIDDLLRLTRIREDLDKQEKIERVDVGQVILDQCLMFEAQANEKGLELEVRVEKDKPSQVQARHQDISDVVENLLSNAIKYTEHGKVTVQGWAEAKRYIFSVKDTGIGIPPQDQKHLFEEFFRASNALISEPHSSGLGLNIVQAIVTRLSGKIDFTSNVGEGTMFRVELPLAQDTPVLAE